MKPKRREVNKFVKPFAAHKWYNLGLELEVGDEDGFDLDDIKNKYGDNKEECFDRMISLWLKEANPSQLTWRVLLESLESLKLEEAVQSIQANIFEGEAKCVRVCVCLCAYMRVCHCVCVCVCDLR